MPMVVSSRVALGAISDPPEVARTRMDESLFSHFYAATARPLRAFLLASCGNQALAEDLLQEAYLRLLRARFEAVDDRHRRNYLFRIASNLLTDHWRRRRELDVEPPESSESSHEEQIQRRSDVAAAMGELTGRDRQMLWLAYVEGSSHEEIAGVLGLKASSIRSMLFRARSRLAASLRARGLGPVWEDGS